MSRQCWKGDQSVALFRFGVRFYKKVQLKYGLSLVLFLLWFFIFRESRRTQSTIPPSRITPLSRGKPTPLPTYQKHVQTHASPGCRRVEACVHTCAPCVHLPAHTHVHTVRPITKQLSRIVHEQGNMGTGRFPEWMVLI